MGTLHNALSRATDLSRGIRRAVGLVDAEAEGVSRVGETLTPTFDIWARPEHALLRGERLVMQGATATAGGAGLRSYITLVNPSTSRIIVVFKQAWWFQQAVGRSCIVRQGVALTGATAVNFAGPIDQRQTYRPGAQLYTNNTLALAAILGQGLAELPSWDMGTRAGGHAAFPNILPPGNTLALICETDNELIVASMEWTERPPLPGELTGELG